MPPLFPNPFSFEWLIHPVARQQFFEERWEKQPLVVNRNQPEYFGALLSLNEVDRVLTTSDRRYPDVALKNAARPVSADEYSGGGGVLDPVKVYQLFQEGSTVTLSYLDTVVPSLAVLCRALESEFTFPFQANVYLTPPAAQGAKPHYDTHDVFVLQITGSKKWVIYGTPVELPLRDQDFDPVLHAQGAPTSEFELHPGDFAYIPRGVVHDAHTADAVSLHITVGVLRYTWADLLLEFIADACLSDPAFRKALPPGFARPEFDRAPVREMLRNLLQKAWSHPGFDTAFDLFVDEFISSCPPLLTGQMAQLAALGAVSLESRAGVRSGVISRLEAEGDHVSLLCYGRKITFPARVRDAVQFALTQPNFAVRDLPGNLDDNGRLVLIRRLIREGLVMVLPLELI